MDSQALHNPFNQLNSFYRFSPMPKIQTFQGPQTQAPVRHSLLQADAPPTKAPDPNVQNDLQSQMPYARLWTSSAPPNGQLVPSSHSVYSNSRSTTFQTSYLRHQLPLDDPPLRSEADAVRDSNLFIHAPLPDPVNAINPHPSIASSPSRMDSPRPSSRASMVTLVDPINHTPEASTSSSEDRPPDPDKESGSVKVKREQLEKNLKKPSPRKKHATPYGLPLNKMAALRTYCDGHAVLPLQKSRKAWADRNKVAVGSVSKACSAIMRWKPDRHTSREPWELPLETIPDDEVDVVVKKEPIEVKKEVIEIGDETLMDTDSNELASTSKHEPPEAAGIEEDTPKAGSSTQNAIPIPSEPSPKPNPFAHLMPNILPDPMKSPTYHANVLKFSAPTTFEESTDHEMMNFLLCTDFFELVKGPYGIKLGDMVDWGNFEAKLVIRTCPFDPIFAWRALKRFYFFF